MKLHLKRCNTKLTGLETTCFIQMAICRADPLQNDLWHGKKSCAQKTICHGKIKSPEAVKSGIAVKLSFTWEGKLVAAPDSFQRQCLYASKGHGGYCDSYKTLPKPQFNILSKIQGCTLLKLH